VRFVGIFNQDGGTFRTMDIPAFCAEAKAIFAVQGHELDCRSVAGKDLIAALDRAAGEPGTDALLVGGGDGTISSAAEVAFLRQLPLAVLPGGTMNLFARALGIPLDLRAALMALAAGELARVDIATANDVPFVHQFGVGVHARLVRIRDGMIYHGRIGKMLASLRAVVATIIKPLRFDVEIETADGVQRLRSSGIAVSNNPFGEGHVPHADRLDAGVLGLYVAKPMSSLHLVKLLIAVILGRWKWIAEVSDREAQHVLLRFPRNKASSQAVIDGELVNLEDLVDIRIHPGALPVIMPAAAG
jgi:diacylglycerol kinase family enzyme